MHCHFPCRFLCILINNQPPLLMVAELMMNREGRKMVGDRDHLFRMINLIVPQLTITTSPRIPLLKCISSSLMHCQTSSCMNGAILNALDEDANGCRYGYEKDGLQRSNLIILYRRNNREKVAQSYSVH